MATLGYFKIGNDVFENVGGGQTRKLTQPEFQTLGINYNLLGEGLPMTRPLDQLRDTETQQFLGQGGQLGQPNAAINAGFVPPDFNQQIVNAGQDPFGLENQSTDSLQKILSQIESQITSQPPINYVDILNQSRQTAGIPDLEKALLDITGQITSRNTAFQSGANVIEEQPIPQPLILGQQAVLERQRQTELGNLIGQQGNIESALGRAEGRAEQLFGATQMQQQEGRAQRGELLNLAQTIFGFQRDIAADRRADIGTQLQLSQDKREQLAFEADRELDPIRKQRLQLDIQSAEADIRYKNAQIAKIFNDIGNGTLTDKDVQNIDKSPQGQSLVLLADLQSAADKYDALIEAYGFAAFGSQKTELDNAYAELQVKWKEAAKLGALTGPDLQLILDAVKPVTGFRGASALLTGGGTTGVRGGIANMIETINLNAARNYEQLLARNTKYQGSEYVNSLYQPFNQSGNEEQSVGNDPLDLVNDPLGIL